MQFAEVKRFHPSDPPDDKWIVDIGGEGSLVLGDSHAAQGIPQSHLKQTLRY